ncbi:MAG: FAD-dependent oxidoreductase, partial [Methanotrichaceae archaeon]|nr:FAD-dependent oxidoreductase [Methanotrichaceae archaeon]
MIIVGAGPAGLTAAIYCARGGRRTLVLGNVYGSQQAIGGLYENYPGFPDGVQGIELSERMLAQARRYGAEVQPELVEKIVHLGDLFRLKTEGWQYEARAVILATGASHRMLGVPGEKEFTSRGVSYCVHCDGALFKDKTVAVVGYGNGAARAVLYLAKICSRVHLLSPQDHLSAEAVYLERLRALSNYSAVFGVQITEIKGDELVRSCLLYTSDTADEFRTV